TIADNTAGSGGGALVNYGSAALTNVTISGNSAGIVGGILGVNGATTTLTNSIVVANHGTGGDISVQGTTLFQGVNLVGIGSDTDASDHVIQTPTLSALFAQVDANAIGVTTGVLADNGGPVQTVALAETTGNPAIDAGDDTLAPTTDARGF